MFSSATTGMLGRRSHYLVLWAILAIVIVASFRPLRGDVLVVTLMVIVASAAYAIIHTRDGGHLARPRFLDVALAVVGAVLALWLTRGLSWSPEVAASSIGLSGAVLIRTVDHTLHYYEAPLFCGAFVGVTATGAVSSVEFLLAGAVVAGAVLAWVPDPVAREELRQLPSRPRRPWWSCRISRYGRCFPIGAGERKTGWPRWLC